MTPLVIGNRDDVVAFALAGVDGVVCTTREEAGQAIEQTAADTLVLVSAELAPSAPQRSLVVVLPARS